MKEWRELVAALRDRLAQPEMQPQTPDDLLRQSEREGWRYAKELEGEVLRLNKENGQLHEELNCEKRRFNDLFDDYDRLISSEKNVIRWTIFLFLGALTLIGLLTYGVSK